MRKNISLALDIISVILSIILLVEGIKRLIPKNDAEVIELE